MFNLNQMTLFGLSSVGLLGFNLRQGKRSPLLTKILDDKKVVNLFGS